MEKMEKVDEKIERMSTNLAVASARAENDQQSLKIVADFVKDLSPEDTAALLDLVNQNILNNLLIARLFLQFLHLPLLSENLGRFKFNEIKEYIKSQSLYPDLPLLFTRLEEIGGDAIQNIRAKVAILIQILFLLNDRLAEKNLPKIEWNGVEIFRIITDDPQCKGIELKLSLHHFPQISIPLLKDILLETDFDELDEDTYSMIIAPVLVEDFASGRALSSIRGKSAYASRLADAIRLRTGENILKRLSLAIRGVMMYPPDHPGIPPLLNGVVSTVEEALVEEEEVTFSLLGGELLFGDLRLKKRSQYVLYLIDELEMRKISSFTFRRGLTKEEVKAFAYLFTEGPSRIKEKGGAKEILNAANVSHILVDQYKIGIIGEGEEEGKSEKEKEEEALTAILLKELVAKVSSGQTIEDMENKEIGMVFKSLLSGKMKNAAELKATIANLVITLDPTVIEKGALQASGVEDVISWSVARKTLEKLVGEVDLKSGEEKVKTIEIVGQLMELAVKRQKVNSMLFALDKLKTWLAQHKQDPQILSPLAMISARLVELMIENRFLDTTLDLLSAIKALIPAEGDGSQPSESVELLAETLENLGRSKQVHQLIKYLHSSNEEVVEKTIKILDIIKNPHLIERMLGEFIHAPRNIRMRIYKVLVEFGRVMAITGIKVLNELSDRSRFERKENGELVDNAYYVIRNVIEILGDIGAAVVAGISQAIAQAFQDPDARVRERALRVLGAINCPQARTVTISALSDKDLSVKEKAVIQAGFLRLREAVPHLVKLFKAEPSLRRAILKSLGDIGGKEAETFLLNIFLRQDGAYADIMDSDLELDVLALRSLGFAGGEATIKELEAFIDRWKNPLKRALLSPLKRTRRYDELVEEASRTIKRIQDRRG